MTDNDNNKNTPAIGHNGGPSLTSNKGDDALVAENRLLSVRLTLAHAFISMWTAAYDALLHHRINVRELPEYKNEALLDAGLKGDLHQGQAKIIEWLKRVESGLVAAVRRKSFKKMQ